MVAKLSYMDNEKRMTVWCRMWNEDPSLAHDLMSDGCVQWSDHAEGLDAVVGPAQQEQFVSRYRARHINVFSPRALVDGGDEFAYLWDVRMADGRVLTGMDFNILEDGRVHENWTFAGDWHNDRSDGPPEPADPAAIEELCHRWVLLRNGQGETENVVAEDFSLFSGRGSTAEVNGPAELTSLLDRSPAVEIHRRPVIDAVHGRVAFLWTTEIDGVKVGGADLLTVRGGRFARAWSITGVRPFRY